MRCPKCHYISFGSAERCRNCGYEFSLAPEAPPLDLPIQGTDAPEGPMGDLPLFSHRAPVDDAPLISAPSAPRPPLSVRRAPPVRAERTLREVEDDSSDPDDQQKAGARGPGAADAAHGAAGDVSAARLREQLVRRVHDQKEARVAPRPPAAGAEPVVAPLFARLLAGAVDVTILLGIDAAVIYFTLRVLELPMSEVRSLAPVPLTVFLLLLNGGYLSIFTAAGGQTVGKMLTGIRVVAAPPDDDQGFDRFTLRVSMGAAVLRAAAYLVSLLPAGLGFVAIVFDPQGRALHDRLADTRVIKA